MDDATLINGLLSKRQELSTVNADLRELMAIVANDTFDNVDDLRIDKLEKIAPLMPTKH